MKFNNAFFSLFLLIFSFAPAKSSANEDMDFHIYRPCEGNGSMCSQYIFANGIITKETPIKFQNFLENNKNDLYSPIIYFNSDGGSLIGGLDLARIIRNKKFDTYIGRGTNVDFNQEEPDKRYKTIVEKSACYSACAYAFLGGVSREIDWNNGKYGVHQFSSNGAIQEDSAQVLTSSLAIFLDEMGVDRGLLDIASFTKKDDMFSLSPKVAKELKVENSGEEASNWTIKANQEGNLSVCSSVKQEDNDSFTALCFFHIRKSLFADIIYLPSKKYEMTDVVNRFNSQEASVDLSLNGIEVKEITKWRHIENGVSKTIAIDNNILKSFSNQKKLSFNAGFSNANKHIDPSAIFITDGLLGGIKALLK